MKQFMERHEVFMRKPEPVDLVQIGIPVLVEAVAVTLFIAACAVWIIIAATPVPA